MMPSGKRGNVLPNPKHPGKNPLGTQMNPKHGTGSPCRLPTTPPPPRGTPGYGRTACPSGGEFISRDLMGVNPLSQQFEPTDSDPVRQNTKMAGDGA